MKRYTKKKKLIIQVPNKKEKIRKSKKVQKNLYLHGTSN